MRKRILFQIIVIVAVFMIVLLFIMDATISQTSILLFTEAKQELLSRDIQGIKSELFHDTEIVPEFLDYCKIHLDDGTETAEVVLDKPFEGLYISNAVWREMYDFSPDAVLMVLASEYYDEKDYIRNYDEFLKYIGKEK